MELKYSWKNKTVSAFNIDKNEGHALISKIQAEVDPLDAVVFLQTMFKNYYINLNTSTEDLYKLFDSYGESQQEILTNQMKTFLEEIK